MQPCRIARSYSIVMHLCTASRLLNVVRRAESLEVQRIPEERHVALVRDDVVDLLRHRDPTLARTLHAEGIAVQHLGAQREPARRAVEIPERLRAGAVVDPETRPAAAGLGEAMTACTEARGGEAH